MHGFLWRRIGYSSTRARGKVGGLGYLQTSGNWLRGGAWMGPFDGNASLRFARGPRRSSRPLRWHGRTSMPTMSLVSFQRRFGSSVDNRSF